MDMSVKRPVTADDVNGRTARLLEAMKDRGIASPAALARATEVPASTARSWLPTKDGKPPTRYPELKTCLEIGPKLGVSGMWLYDGKGHKNQVDLEPVVPADAPTVDIYSKEALLSAAVEEALLVLASQEMTQKKALLTPELARLIAVAIRRVISVQHHAILDMRPEGVVRWTVRRDVGLLLDLKKPTAQ